MDRELEFEENRGDEQAGEWEMRHQEAWLSPFRRAA